MHGADAIMPWPITSRRCRTNERAPQREGERINLRDQQSRAHGCGCFSCNDQELIEAVRSTGSIEVGAVGLYLATGYVFETFEASDAS
jgi:hypothetical protein